MHPSHRTQRHSVTVTSIATIFLTINALALLVLPRRWASLPLVMGACYITRGQGIDVGPFSFTVLRILVLIGIVRLALRRENTADRNALDYLMLAWGLWMICSVYFHRDAQVHLIERSGLVFDGWGVYFLFRAFCRSWDEMARLCAILAVLLAPIAVAMVFEKATVHNAFSVFDGVPELPAIREGKVRAQGPFAHSILAGNIGAVSLPMMMGLWTSSRAMAVFGSTVCLVMVYASASSGPIITALIGTLAVLCWPYRHRMRQFRWAAILIYLALSIVMKSPPYYLIARIDLTGGSTGWHRARLIQSSFEHISEWWFAGTNFTRHWMPTGVSYSSDHTDITNHYIMMGVRGGVPLMLIFIAMLATAFALIGRSIRQPTAVPPKFHFLVWAYGASLFAHAVTCIAVAYFDQSIIFLYLALAAAGAVGVTALSVQPTNAGTRPMPGAISHVSFGTPIDIVTRAHIARRTRHHGSPLSRFRRSVFRSRHFRRA